MLIEIDAQGGLIFAEDYCTQVVLPTFEVVELNAEELNDLDYYLADIGVYIDEEV